MGEIRVQDEQGNIHVFPDGSTPEMIAQALHVKPRDTASHIGVNTGPQTTSPGYQYSTGYAGENDAPRDSGGFIDRLTTQAGRALQNPMNFLPSPSAILGPLDPTPLINAYHQFQAARQGAPAEDPAKTLGNMMPAALSALVTHAADAIPNPMQAGMRQGLQGVREGMSAPAPQPAPAPVRTAPPPVTVPESEFGAPSGISNPLHGESALSNLLTQLDNPTLLKIAQSRGIPTSQLRTLKPGIGNPQLVKSIVADFSPDELSEISAQTLENSRFQHQFGNISDEAWRTIALQTYFPNVKIPLAQLRRAAISIQKAGK